MEMKDEKKGYLLWEIANAKNNGYKSFAYDTLTGMWHGKSKLLRYHDIYLQKLKAESRCMRGDIFDMRKELDTLKRRWRICFTACISFLVLANILIFFILR